MLPGRRDLGWYWNKQDELNMEKIARLGGHWPDIRCYLDIFYNNNNYNYCYYSLNMQLLKSQQI